MELTSFELDFVKRLSNGAWISPPVFDRTLVARLIERGYVRAETLASGEVRYEITQAGLSGIILEG